MRLQKFLQPWQLLTLQKYVFFLSTPCRHFFHWLQSNTFCGHIWYQKLGMIFVFLYFLNLCPCHSDVCVCVRTPSYILFSYLHSRKGSWHKWFPTIWALQLSVVGAEWLPCYFRCFHLVTIHQTCMLAKCIAKSMDNSIPSSHWQTLRQTCLP